MVFVDLCKFLTYKELQRFFYFANYNKSIFKLSRYLFIEPNFASGGSRGYSPLQDVFRHWLPMVTEMQSCHTHALWCYNVFMKNLRRIAKHSRKRFDKVLAKKSVTHSVTGRKRVNCSFNEQDFRKLIAFAKKSGRKPTAVLRETFFAYLGKEFLLPGPIKT